MAKKTKKSGLPKSVQQAVDQEEGKKTEPTLEEHIQELHGTEALAKPQEGLPSIEWLQGEFKTKSAVIRYLINQNFTVNQIHKHTGWRYQMVRNIATNNLKRGPNEDWRKPLLKDTSIPDAKHFAPETESKPKAS